MGDSPTADAVNYFLCTVSVSDEARLGKKLIASLTKGRKVLFLLWSDLFPSPCDHHLGFGALQTEAVVCAENAPVGENHDFCQCKLADDYLVYFMLFPPKKLKPSCCTYCTLPSTVSARKYLVRFITFLKRIAVVSEMFCFPIVSFSDTSTTVRSIKVCSH